MFLVPISVWIAASDGNAIYVAMSWAIGAGVFNAVWFPHLRRGTHPPDGLTPTIAAVTSMAGVIQTSELWLTLSMFVLINLVLGWFAGVHRLAFVQLMCVAVMIGVAVRDGQLDNSSGLLFAGFVVPMTFSSLSFVSAGVGHRERMLDRALRVRGSTAWDIDDHGVVRAVLGRTIAEVMPGTVLSSAIHSEDHRPGTPEPGAVFEYRIANSTGGWHWIRETVQAAAPGSAGLRSSIADITVEKQSIHEDRRRANIDALTGIANRSSHIDVAEQWAAAGTGHLVLVDLDDFKQINDTLGHSIGDQTLRTVTERLAAVDDGVHVARLGGDEFACLVPGSPEPIEKIAARMVAAVDRPLTINSMTIYSSASAGIAAFGSGRTDDEVRRRAGVALRAAKSVGGAAAVEYNATLEQQSKRQAELAADLPSALTSGEISAHHQPQIELADRQMAGFEALARWEHPTQGLLTPGEFMDLVSVGGLHRPLYLAVLDRALADLAAIRSRSVETLGPDLTVAVNLDARNLREDDLVERTVDALHRHGLDPRHLVLELTEEALIGESTPILLMIDRLAATGIRLSIDDFGSGYSSMSYLHRLPVSEVKLDRSLITDLGISPRAQAVVESVLDLAKRLGLRVVAEGIEDAETAVLLSDLGCAIGQGFHFAQPQPMIDWIELGVDLPALEVDATISPLRSG